MSIEHGGRWLYSQRQCLDTGALHYKEEHMKRFLIQLLQIASIFSIGAAANPLLAADSTYFKLQAISPGVYAAIVEKEDKGGANAGVIIGKNGVAVVDTFFDVNAAHALVAEIRKLTPLPIRYVINTHYHIDHVAGNAVFQNLGALIIAHPNFTKWQHSENLKFFGKQPSDADQKLLETLPDPAIESTETLRLNLGGRYVVVKSYSGHTGGDLIAHIPDAGVIFCGDLFWNRAIPNLIDASVSPWIGTLDEFAKLPATKHFIPGHGAAGERKDVREFQKYLENLRSLATSFAKSSEKEEEVTSSIENSLRPQFGQWDYFSVLIRRNIAAMLAEISGNKRLPPVSHD